MRRFINADGFISTGQGLLSHNMYAYCNNNPINMQDENGTSGIGLITLLLVAVVLVLYTCTIIENNVDTSGGELIQDIGDSLPSISLNTKTTKSTKTATKTQTKTKEDKNAEYYMAQRTYPGAKVYLSQPLSFENAKNKLNFGGDIWTEEHTSAINLCIAVGGRYTGPTNDNDPLAAMHYHPVKYILRGHVFVGKDDPNLCFIP